MLSKVADKFKRKLWGCVYFSLLCHKLILKFITKNYLLNIFFSWTWVEAGAQMDLEQTLGMGNFGYPAMSVLNTKKQISSLFKGSFSEEGINEFLR